jgi:hypothetical protein
MEVIQLKSDGLEEIKLNFDTVPMIPTTSLPGVELLMNTKKKEPGIQLSELDKLENELNNLTQPSFNKQEPKSEFKPDVNLDFPRIEINDLKPEIKVDFNLSQPVKVDKSWDGFKSINIVDPDKMPTKENVADTLREKFKILRKLEDIESKGGKLTRKYTMDSSLDEMKGEYENIISEKERTNNVKFQGKMLMATITGLEFLNSKFDPFDIKLDGWAEQVNENITDYDEIFAELHDKYKSKAKLAPELKLLFQLGGGAIMLHMTNTMFKSSLPGMDDIMRQNPELMQKFTQAAVNSMGTSNPGFSGFMNNMMPNMSHPSSSPPGQSKRQDRSEPKRPDMKGPTDINEILSGLKPKSSDELSIVSLSELKEMKEGLKSRRKKSDKHTVNLDL